MLLGMYFIEVFATFLFFLFLGALISPFLGGCLVFFIILFVMALLVVLFSLNFIWLVAFGLFLYVAGYVNKIIRYRKIPELSQYSMTHPVNSYSDVTCYKCGSSQITNKGLFTVNSKYRYYVCSQCGTTLYRFKVL